MLIQAAPHSTQGEKHNEQEAGGKKLFNHRNNVPAHNTHTHSHILGHAAFDMFVRRQICARERHEKRPKEKEREREREREGRDFAIARRQNSLGRENPSARAHVHVYVYIRKTRRGRDSKFSSAALEKRPSGVLKTEREGEKDCDLVIARSSFRFIDSH